MRFFVALHNPFKLLLYFKNRLRPKNGRKTQTGHKNRPQSVQTPSSSQTKNRIDPSFRLAIADVLPYRHSPCCQRDEKTGENHIHPPEDHFDLLALLNETIGGSAGSSDKERLIPRIYRKWKDALPDLENGPLFKVLGRKKELEDGVGKTYHFTEAEKDNWANLFEYRGSEENVRLRFSIDKLGASLDDIVILYEGYQNAEAWESLFQVSNRREKRNRNLSISSLKEPETPVTPPEKWKIALRSQWQWAALAVVIVLAAALAIWRGYFYSPPGRVASVERMAFPLPDKPSIAVLPFVNMTDDPRQESFCDGLSEEIITTLSKIPKLFVIARNSTFTYKGKPVKVQQVAEELGVQYVLEGSVRRAGEQVRITAQLTDALSGHHLWAERYDRKPKDIFAVQDEITKHIITALQVKLTDGEQARVFSKGTKNLDAYMKVMEATWYSYQTTIEGNIRARQLAEEAISLDPNYA